LDDGDRVENRTPPLGKARWLAQEQGLKGRLGLGAEH
jgi:hypothetical protein